MNNNISPNWFISFIMLFNSITPFWFLWKFDWVEYAVFRKWSWIRLKETWCSWSEQQWFRFFLCIHLFSFELIHGQDQAQEMLHFIHPCNFLLLLNHLFLSINSFCFVFLRLKQLMRPQILCKKGKKIIELRTVLRCFCGPYYFDLIENTALQHVIQRA